jgi:fructokinase
MTMDRDEASQSPPTDRPPVAVVGEVLFDCFPDGSRVLGGAPFNVAWHLAGFGFAPRFISRVGDDAAGAEVRGAMAAWGMSVDDLQVDTDAATGRVEVRGSAHGEPSYTIVPDQAFDRIEPAGGPPLTTDTVLYHGSLALRDARARASVEACVASAGPVFVDCNLRSPWWAEDTLATMVQRARWVKLNAEELAVVSRVCGVPERHRPVGDGADALRQAIGAAEVIVTAGQEGAVAADADGVVRVAAPVTEVVDTVGAGDAFSAVVLAGILEGWPAPTRLERAVAFAARVCRVRGALINRTETYADVLAGWEGE